VRELPGLPFHVKDVVEKTLHEFVSARLIVEEEAMRNV